MKVTKSISLSRQHAQHRRLDLTISFVWQNPNPPHIYDCTDRQLEDVIGRLMQQNLLATLPDMLLDTSKNRGFIHADFIAPKPEWSVKVKARELGLNGKPLTIWGKIRYLLTGRYWY